MADSVKFSPENFKIGFPTWQETIEKELRESMKFREEAKKLMKEKRNLPLPLEDSEDEIPIWEKLLLTIEETASYSNIGIHKIRELVANPMCEFVLHVGKKSLIKRKEFEKYISQCLEI